MKKWDAHEQKYISKKDKQALPIIAGLVLLLDSFTS